MTQPVMPMPASNTNLSEAGDNTTEKTMATAYNSGRVSSPALIHSSLSDSPPRNSGQPPINKNDQLNPQRPPSKPARDISRPKRYSFRRSEVPAGARHC